MCIYTLCIILHITKAGSFTLEKLAPRLQASTSSKKGRDDVRVARTSTLFAFQITGQQTWTLVSRGNPNLVLLDRDASVQEGARHARP